MSSVNTQRLIEFVKQQPCLYDSTHKEYKNVATKNEIWEAIGRELNSTGDVVKNKWKTLRDAFTKNRKQIKEKGFMRTYTWAPQLAFLDKYIQKQQTLESTSSPVSMEFDPFASVDVSVETNTEKESPLEDTISIEEPEKLPSSKATKRKIQEEDDITRIINFLSKKKKKDDAISLLFTSYAETFRNFPINHQISLKVHLAKLFSDVELKLLSNSNINHDNLTTEEQNDAQPEDESIAQDMIRSEISIKIEPQDSSDDYHDDDPSAHKEIKVETEIERRNDQLIRKQLAEKEELLQQAREEIHRLKRQMEVLKTKNVTLENRNASLEAAVDDLKHRLNNLV